MKKIEKVRKLLDLKPKDGGSSMTPNTIAERAGCDPSLVYNEIRRRREADEATGMIPRMDPPKNLSKTVGPLPVVSMEIKLPRVDDRAEIKLRIGAGTGDLRGTLAISGEGISYRRPNQKIEADRCLSWSVLDKLMQLGLV